MCSVRCGAFAPAAKSKRSETSCRREQSARPEKKHNHWVGRAASLTDVEASGYFDGSDRTPTTESTRLFAGDRSFGAVELRTGLLLHSGSILTRRRPAGRGVRCRYR